MNVSGRYLGYRALHPSIFPLLLASPKSLSYSARLLALPNAHPYKSAELPSATNATTRIKRVAPKSASKPLPSSSSVCPSDNTTTVNTALNPPSTARPPLLALPVINNSTPTFRYYFNLGKAYLAFYKNGLKGIYSNYKIAEDLPNRLFHPLFVSRQTLYAAAMANKLSRAELQLLIRLRADTKVLPLFALVLVCCGEFTPLLVPWLTAIVPPSVHIPSQTKALRERAEKKRHEARLEGPPEWRSIRNIWGIKPPQLHDKYIGATNRRLAIELGLYPQWWKKIPWMFELLLVERRLISRLRDLQYDDLTIIRDGGVKQMISEEVTMACDRRGFAVEGKDENELRRMLEGWLRDRNSDWAQEFVEWVSGLKWEDWRDKRNN